MRISDWSSDVCSSDLERDCDIVASLDSGGDRGADRGCNALPDNSAATEVHRSIEQVHVPTQPVRQPRLLTEDFGCHRTDVDTLGDRDVMRPMRGRHEIAGPQGGADHDRAWLLDYRSA